MRACSRGFTLAEMLTVCAVLGIAAVVAIPTAAPVAETRADTAAGEVVLALRFAREEAMRTGANRMLGCDLARNSLSVYIPDANGAVAAMVANPLSKMDYTVVLGQAPAGGNIALAACSFQFDKDFLTTVEFDGGGNPVRGIGDPKKQVQPLVGGTVRLGIGNVTRTVSIDATGRVTAS